MLPITDAVYSSYESPRDKSVFKMAREVILQKDYESLLDVGCATGDFLSLLNHSIHCSGVDISPKLIELARSRLPNSIGLDCYDFFDNKRSISSSQTYDIISCFAVSGYFACEEDFLRPLILSSSSNSLLLISGLFNMNGLTVQTLYKRSGDAEFSPGLNQLNFDVVSNILSSSGFTVNAYPVIVDEIIPYNSRYPHRAYSVNLDGYSLMNGANLLLSDFLIVAER